MADAARTPTRMTAAEFLAWSQDWGEGERYELSAGEPVAMSPQTNRHVLVKMDVAAELRRAVEAAGAPCTVLGDGVTVVVDEGDAFGPDAAVLCNGAVDLDAQRIDDPTILVEVVSRSSRGADTNRKLTAYFSLPSLAHYLVVDPVKKLVTRHSRRADGGIDTAILREGVIRLDPPGLEAALARFFARV